MRPSAGGGDALTERSSKSSFADPQVTLSVPGPGPGHGAPTTFFLAREEDMMQRSSTTSRSNGGSNSVYGVQSLEDAIEAAVIDDSQSFSGVDDDDAGVNMNNGSGGVGPAGGSPQQSSKITDNGSPFLTTEILSDAVTTTSLDASCASPSRLVSHRLSHTSLSRPLTPLFLHSPALGSSLPSSPKSISSKSYRHSDEESVLDDAVSQAMSSGEDEGDSPNESSMQSSAPQLIMPSIQMPSRRPFTERGRNMGRLKVLIAGDSGTGKSSLIKSIVQTCEDIVHVDPLSPSLPTLPRKSSTKSNDAAKRNSTKEVEEVYASTKAYPSWWSDLEESRILRRRKGSGDVVLERNLCFVDTPGYSNGTAFLDNVDSVIQYVESQLFRTASMINLSDGDILGLLSGSGGAQVDVVFYLIQNGLKSVDIEYLRRLSPLTNVIPLISKADISTHENILNLKKSILAGLQAADIRPFLFGRSLDDVMQCPGAFAPYAVSSATSNDADNMDASVLMSPDYMPPLVETELRALVARTFDNIPWLRHAAAKKFVQWRHHALASSMLSQSLTTSVQKSSSKPTSPNASQASSILVASSATTPSQVLVTHGRGASSYALARVADHKQREEHLAQLSLAKWANDLQRSLQNERERFEALARGERAVWLTQRLGECVIDGTLLPASLEHSVALVKQTAHRGPKSSTGKERSGAMVNPHDPLGLLQWNEDFKRRSWLALQVLGSCGVIGGLIVWLGRNWFMNGGSLVNLNRSWWMANDNVRW